MKNKYRNLRKAAILIASLDAENADALLRQMTPDQAELLRQAVDNLSNVESGEQDEVIEEFFRIGPLVPDKEPSGIELDGRLPRNLATSLERSRSGSASTSWNVNSSPFQFLHDASPRAIAPLLGREHPQTIAVVVSHLPSNQAAEVLAALPADLQIEVARRLVDLDETDPEILREIESGLESWLGRELRSSQRRAAGITTLTNILSAASPMTKQSILNNLARRDSQLAGRVEAVPTSTLTFGDLDELDSASLRVISQRAPADLLVLALAGSSLEFSTRVLELLSRSEGERLRHALKELGPTRLSDVEEAQQAVADLAAQLERRGEISSPSSGHLSVAV